MNNGKVTYGVEFTRNLGNYQNVKPHFEVSLDVGIDSLDDLDEIKDKLAEKVDEWLFQKVEELDKELG
jgi:hypothetical protein